MKHGDSNHSSFRLQKPFAKICTCILGLSPQASWLNHFPRFDYRLFGLAYDEQRYNDVLRACALTTDLALFEDGGELLCARIF